MDQLILISPRSQQNLSYHLGARLCGFTHSWEMDRHSCRSISQECGGGTNPVSILQYMRGQRCARLRRASWYLGKEVISSKMEWGSTNNKHRASAEDVKFCTSLEFLLITCPWRPATLAWNHLACLRDARADRHLSLFKRSAREMSLLVLLLSTSSRHSGDVTLIRIISWSPKSHIVYG